MAFIHENSLENVVCIMSQCVVHISWNSVRYWPFVRRIYGTPMVSPQRPATGDFDVGLNKPLNSRRWFETLWRWYDVTAMNLRVINKAGFAILNSLIFFAFFTNTLFGSFWLFTSIPKAVLAITSIVKFSQMLKRNEWCHDDVIKWKQFPHYWSFVRWIQRSPVNSPHKRPVTWSFDVFFDLRPPL